MRECTMGGKVFFSVFLSLFFIYFEELVHVGIPKQGIWDSMFVDLHTGRVFFLLFFCFFFGRGVGG